MTAADGPDLPDEEVRAPAPAVVDEDGQPADGETGADPAELVDLAARADALAGELSERTTDLQRITAEYANYRKRAERDREQAREEAAATIFAELLAVLDDIGRAREHDELVGGFRSVAEALEATVAKLGLERFGEVGDPFDPEIHEALSHTHSADVTETTAVGVMQPGYRYGGRIVRPARVAVADPE